MLNCAIVRQITTTEIDTDYQIQQISRQREMANFVTFLFIILLIFILLAYVPETLVNFDVCLLKYAECRIMVLLLETVRENYSVFDKQQQRHGNMA